MARSYQIQIGNIFLTSDGTSGGTFVRCSVPQADDILDNFLQSVTIANDGAATVQVFEPDIPPSRILDIIPSVWIPKAVWDDLRTLRTTALTNSETINIVGTGDTGNFDVDAIPLKFSAKRFTNSRIYEVQLSFVTV